MADMNHKYIFPNVVLIIVVLFMQALDARSDDSTKPINIKADSAEINDATGVSIYKGNVVITQGTMKLTGDVVTLETANKKVKVIISQGDLSTFTQVTDDGRTVNAEAEKMVYKISDNEIVLTQRAKLTEAGNSFASDRIVFYTNRETILANDRVNITVFPDTIDSLKEEESQ